MALLARPIFFKIPMAGPEKGVRCRYQQVCVLSGLIKNVGTIQASPGTKEASEGPYQV